MRKLNKMLLNNQWAKEKIIRETVKYLELFKITI